MLRRYLSHVATRRGGAQLVGGVIAVAGLATTLADSKHWAVGVGVILCGAVLWLFATFWVRLSMAAVQTAADHGVETARAVREPELDEVARLMRTELQSIQARLTAHRREGKFSRGIHPFPAQRWDEYRSVLARRAPDAYDAVQDAYVRADALNHIMVERANLYAGRWLSFHDDDGLDEFDQSLSGAIARLEALAGGGGR